MTPKPRRTPRIQMGERGLEGEAGGDRTMDGADIGFSAGCDGKENAVDCIYAASNGFVL